MSDPFHSDGYGRALNTVAAWTLGLLWFLPLAYAIWTAFHALTKFSSVSGAVRSKRTA